MKSYSKMTIEEKAKAYDKALSKAREYHFQGQAPDKLAELESIFPELRESEDERIRKEIINYLDFAESHNLLRAEDYEKKKGWLAYLEKQKEPTTEELYAEAGTTEKEYIANTMKMVRAMRERKKEQKPISQEDFDTAKHEALWDEQKPAEWSEKHIADIFEKVGLAKIAREQGNDKLTNALQDAMLELSKVENAEWSKEDEWKRKELIQYLKEKGDYRTTWMTWLKCLPERFNLQPKQEWSEEDENVYKTIIDDFNGITQMSKAYKLKAADFLKSLRPQPHWKPSEGQMEALFTVLEHEAEREGHSKALEIANGFYDNLKKLGVKEEPKYYQHFDPDC